MIIKAPRDHILGQFWKTFQGMLGSFPPTREEPGRTQVLQRSNGSGASGSLVESVSSGFSWEDTGTTPCQNVRIPHPLLGYRLGGSFEP